MPTTKLDRRSVDALPGPAAGKSEVTHWDEDLPGLGLRVLASGARTWIVRYRIGKRLACGSAGQGRIAVACRRPQAGRLDPRQGQARQRHTDRDHRGAVTGVRYLQEAGRELSRQGHRASPPCSIRAGGKALPFGRCRAVARSAVGGDHPQARRGYARRHCVKGTGRSGPLPGHAIGYVHVGHEAGAGRGEPGRGGGPDRICSRSSTGAQAVDRLDGGVRGQ